MTVSVPVMQPSSLLGLVDGKTRKKCYLRYGHITNEAEGVNDDVCTEASKEAIWYIPAQRWLSAFIIHQFDEFVTAFDKVLTLFSWCKLLKLDGFMGR
jgi:hypothetical protein